MDRRIKILFLIHDLGEGGAEKVLVNLVNNMDRDVFDITVMTLFDVGVNRQFLREDITYKYCFKHMIRGNSHLMKLLPPTQLHRLLIREKYDIEVAYLEGPTTRVISGCRTAGTKKVAWVHRQQNDLATLAASYRSCREAEQCYRQMDRIIAVSDYVRRDFCSLMPINVPVDVLYNTNETDQIRALAKESVTETMLSPDEIKLVGVGKLLKSKGFDRLARVTRRLLKDGFPVHVYLLGVGPEEENLKRYVSEHGMEKAFTLLGYQTNPYKFMANCDLFVCASLAEGFSTAATEALIVGTPVVTVDVSGMKEMLGENDEYGVVVTNETAALYRGIRRMLSQSDQLKHYRLQAQLRGDTFAKERTVDAVEAMLKSL